MYALHAKKERLEGMRSGAWLSCVNLLCVIGVCAVSAFMLWQMRLDAGRQAAITSRSLVQLLGRDIARNLEMYDLSLRAVVDGMKLPAVANADPETRQMILFDRAATAKNFGYILVFDSKGNLIISSKSNQPQSLNYADREYFQYHLTHADPGLHISQPILSRLTDRWVLVLSRRISNPDGSFGGVAIGSIYLDYFRQLFEAVRADHAGTVTLYGSGGSIIMREPYDERAIGQTVAGTESYDRVQSTGEGSFNGPAMIGEGSRNFVFAQVGNLPLRLSIAVRPEEIYASWWRKALVLAAVVGTLCITTMVLTHLFRRELVQRKCAQQVTDALNIELQKLATTDALTGLANRRRFDEVLDQEWRSAVRSGHSLSLLVMDADYFKGFNDRYGHQKGDEALQVIARSIEAGIDRSSDVACRIGGEEFAVLLPKTDVAGAKVVGERIRTLVSAWKTPHTGNPHGILTVSGGAAEMSPSKIIAAAALVSAADSALYEAKAQGRNQIQVASRKVTNLHVVSR
ncbi:GGDEF domain-containing protein [Methylobacterium gnaphalii]|uniref:diguanylate cyclase n=1 Tax=Methylobacterium gnaphalii TaxID=1010610 RepID=A0A512JS81_9HYPH|nr:sensor domain-containing diguanylate cyclase [Methylobacterium gnaphalii]GEP12818.1 deoxyribonuclease [Methylobacterium gnaphalii]GJD71784.1 hypothetical protein MMMDOFMJ_4749 [Methylobacterium gnaphalii]GLS51292.1 deoxyribonuclease [Methylobacterium gnaphalii]